MLLHNVHIKDIPGVKTIHIKEGLIFSITDVEKNPQHRHEVPSLYFENAIAFPGLINSHDHLDFNLFPRLGNRKYNNYVEWGTDIHQHNKKEIDAVLKIPQTLRIQWGIYKNLLNGFTTVVNHGAHLKVEHNILNVFQHCYSLHSIQLEKNWKLKLNKPYKENWPIVIHAGEGTDELAAEEIDKLIQWNIRKRKIIAVHGVAMNKKQAKHFEGLIWCPATNIFLLNKTAPVDLLKKETTIVFGTDSTLTASWNIWEQLRLARDLGLLTDDELYDAVTIGPAKLWKLEHTGSIQEKAVADIIIGRKKTDNFLDSFFAVDPEDILLVVQNGVIRLFDGSLFDQLKNNGFGLEKFTKIKINEDYKYVYGNVPELIRNIRKHNAAVHLPVSVA